ncbi:unnamed protein product [Victoria cruziana]
MWAALAIRFSALLDPFEQFESGRVFGGDFQVLGPPYELPRDSYFNWGFEGVYSADRCVERLSCSAFKYVDLMIFCYWVLGVLRSFLVSRWEELDFKSIVGADDVCKILVCFLVN